MGGGRMSESNPLEREMFREAQVLERAGHADILAELERSRVRLVQREREVAELRRTVNALESVVREYERLASTNE